MIAENSEELYPVSVKGVPASLTVPNARYRWSVVVVLFSLILFVVFYLALAAASLFLLYEAVIYRIAGGSGSLFL